MRAQSRVATHHAPQFPWLIELDLSQVRHVKVTRCAKLIGTLSPDGQITYIVNGDVLTVCRSK